MVSVHTEVRLFFFILIIFVLIKSNSTETQFRSSNIELIPKFVILNSTSMSDFLCINHQPNNESIVINLSKNISNDQLKLFYSQLNQTTIHIRIHLRDYLGIFHLFCYSKNKKYKGTRADVIVKTEPGLIQLAKPCQVYDRQYIKCIIHAPIIARAIQNDFPAAFQFTENTNLQAYNIHNEFLKNESTNEYLIFKWLPIIDGEFPNGILMGMTIRLPYFTVAYYRFDMTPIFVIKPNFVLNKLSKNKIQIRLTSISPPAICEKSIISKTNMNISRTWTMIESIPNTSTIISNLLFDTTYQICIRCRQSSNDPYGIEECQEMKTSIKYLIPTKIIIILIVISFCLILFLIFRLIYRLYRHRQVIEDEPSVPDEPVDDDSITDINQTKYTVINPSDYINASEPQTVPEYSPLFRQ